MAELNRINNVEELYSYCKKEIVKLVMERITNADLAEDITSDIFMGVMAHEKWFFTIDAARQVEYVHDMAGKMCTNYLAVFERKIFEFKEEAFGGVEAKEDTYDFVETDEMERWIRDLPDIERRTVEKRYIQNKSIEVIAMEEGVSENAVSKRLSRARSRIKNTATDYIHDSI